MTFNFDFEIFEIAAEGEIHNQSFRLYVGNLELIFVVEILIRTAFIF